MARNTVHKCAVDIDSRYSGFRHSGFSERHPSPGDADNIFREIADRSRGLVTMSLAGTSFEGRPIRLMSIGKGTTPVLLWSQMHGDEPTATMAIADILNYLCSHSTEEHAACILTSLALHIVPMLNPDGAALVRRRTAQYIDMNRDALTLRTPEARILKSLHHTLKPRYGYNLHDQELSTVGSSTLLTAIALLAPAFDPIQSDNPVRRSAKHLAACISQILQSYASNRIARYDDAYEPRAFGDSMQRWGTSTVLIESGHAIDDPRKDSIRKLNVIGIISSLVAIATGYHITVPIDEYESLPPNTKRAFDLIIRNISIEHGEGKVTPADLAISYQVDTHTERIPILGDLGDLQTFIGLREIDGKGIAIPANILQVGMQFSWEDYVR